ncbi:hypothetical protein FW755_09385 [Lonepinella koalarum]|uniref:hypothetical protein n=1 Tax=Lonepinella koalarum TaxID=53417 RepID=UPI0011E4A30B|nr:hypothetical protein [Lonepinella koalarum]TYG35289.1 hypothetical protein FW755_09385 [Lonepinella koalarum]
MSENIGYRLGSIVKKYKNWKHPTMLKWGYFVFLAMVAVIMFLDFFMYLLFFVFCFIALVLYSNLTQQPTSVEQEHDEAGNLGISGIYQEEMFGKYRTGRDGYGYYTASGWFCGESEDLFGDDD